MKTIMAQVANEMADFITTEANRTGRTFSEMAGWLIMKGIVDSVGYPPKLVKYENGAKEK